jgi:hypothetical protein
LSVSSSIKFLLREDPIEILSGLPFKQAGSTEDSRKKTEGFNQVFELPEFSDDSLREWERTPPLDARELPPFDVDKLAWYQPYSNYGPRAWGIYFDTVKMNHHALLVYAAAKSVRPELKPSTVVRAFWDEVMRHEREHAVQELTLAVLVQMGAHPPMDSNSVYSASAETFEALAAHYQHTDAVYRKPTSDAIDRNFVRHVTASIRKPAGYIDWDQINLDSAAESAFGLSFAPDMAVDIAIRLRKQVRKVVDNRLVDIPIYVG